MSLSYVNPKSPPGRLPTSFMPNVNAEKHPANPLASREETSQDLCLELSLSFAGKMSTVPHPTALTAPALDAEPGMHASPTRETRLGISMRRSWPSSSAPSRSAGLEGL